MRRMVSFNWAATIDFHVWTTLVLRAWSIVAGIVTLVAIPVFFSKSEQGYYFTFASVLALQIFFELGLNGVLSQVVAAEMRKLYWGEDGRVLLGDETSLQRLGSLIGTVSRIYRSLSILFFFTVGFGGMYFFTINARGETPKWLLSWWLLVGFTSGNLYCSPFMAIAEGTGKVGQVARLRMVQSRIGYVLAWMAMAAGFGLLAMPLISGSLLLGSLIWLNREGWFLKDLEQSALLRGRLAARIDWHLEILPFQWRIAVSWMSGYLIFQLFNPVIFSYYGAVEAGRVGLGLTIFGSLMGLSMSWMGAKAPEFARLISAGESAKARQLFKTQFIVSGLVNLLLCGVLVVAIILGILFRVPKMERLPDMTVVTCLALVTVANHAIFSFAIYMRSHREEPMLLPSIVTGVVMLAIVGSAGKSSIFLTMALYASVTVFLTLPWAATLFFRRYWRPNIED